MRAVDGAVKIIGLIFRLSKKHKVFSIVRLFLAPLFIHIFGEEYLYKQVELFEDYIKDDFLLFVGSTENKTVLDVGCGPGALTRVTSGIGIDIIKYPQWAGNFLIGDAKQLPFKTASFDLVILSNLLEHTDNVEMVISEAKRVSRDLIYVTFPAKYSLSAVYHYLGIKAYFYGGLDYESILNSFTGFTVLKMRDRILPFNLKNNFSNPEILISHNS
jgi:SAM-dependent methyltransferase